jgi:hypothetical protein
VVRQGSEVDREMPFVCRGFLLLFASEQVSVLTFDTNPPLASRRYAASTPAASSLPTPSPPEP